MSYSAYQEGKEETKKFFQTQTTVVGKELAEKVATALQTNRLGYGHRDYCGMGLDYKDGVYWYGEVWDGYLEGKISFPDRDQFVHWLAQQSDASLARLEDSDPFFWGNQTLSLSRFKEFVAAL